MSFRIWLPPLILAAVGLTTATSCDRQVESKMRKQANATLTFFGVALDQAERPLSGVHVEVEVEAIPKDWTFATRGKPHNYSTLEAVTGSDGQFRFEVSAHILRFSNVSRDGYRHFFDRNAGGSQAIDNTFYRISDWGDVKYKTDANHPAVYVFVKDGAHDISVLPCRGGFTSNGTSWIENKPGWPRQPSLEDVVYKPPATQPASQPTTQP